MTLHVDDPGFLALERVAHAGSAEAVAQRERERRRAGTPSTPSERDAAIGRIVEEISRIPVLDDRSPDELVGYDDDGLPA